MEQHEMILFDTDVTIDYLRGNPEVIEFAGYAGIENLFINSIIRMEVLYKAIDKKDLQRIKKLLDALPSIPLESAISDIFEATFETYALSHRPAIPDMLVAATCLYYDIALFTFNKKDYHYIKYLHLVQHDLKPMPRKGGSWFV
jgi:tRNA(fMet)-specific endonuclease VapC